jgi:PAS domain-containing protein
LNIGLQHSWQMYAMAVIVGFVTVMVMRWWRYRRAGAGGDSSPLSLVINNMTQGVILFDAHERILVCNDRYIEMYGLSPDVIKPGCTLLGLIEHRITTGSLNIDPEKYRSEILSAVQQDRSMNRIVETPDGRPFWWSTARSKAASSGSGRMTTLPIVSMPSERARRCPSKSAAASRLKRRFVHFARMPRPCWRR